MSIKFKVVARQNPSDRTQPAKFYAQAVSTGKTTLRPLSKKIEQISTVSSVDTMAVLEAFIQLIPEEMAESNIVKLGDFGSFSLTLNSEGAETEAAFTAGRIKKYTVRFRPGKLFKDVLNAAGYKKE